MYKLALCTTLAVAALLVCGGCAENEIPKGPFDLWVFVDKSVPEYKQANVAANHQAAQLLNDLIGTDCFGVIKKEWTDELDNIPSGVIVSLVDTDWTQEVAERQAPGYIARGFAHETAVGGGYIVMHSVYRDVVLVLAHEIAHIALRDYWPHDPYGLMVSGQSQTKEFAPRTLERLQKVCGAK